MVISISLITLIISLLVGYIIIGIITFLLLIRAMVKDSPILGFILFPWVIIFSIFWPYIIFNAIRDSLK